MKEKSTLLLAALLLAAGLMVGGDSIGRAIRHYADKDRVVTVKGLSTREVSTDHAVWPMRFSVQGNDLQILYRDMSSRRGTIVQFLQQQGFRAEDIQSGNVSVSDNWASYYGARPEYHYTLTATLVVSTDDVELVRRSQGCQTELLNRGIILDSQEWGLDYQFNGLNELKPEMVEEATKNARAVAQKFADDANCRLGSIRNAYQGQFSIESDDNRPWIKHVRVVTTIDYYLD